MGEPKLSDLEDLLILFHPTLERIDCLSREKAHAVAQTDYYSSESDLRRWWRSEFIEVASNKLADIVEEQIRSSNFE